MVCQQLPGVKAKEKESSWDNPHTERRKSWYGNPSIGEVEAKES